MSSKADHLLNLREEGLIVSTENDKDKCLYSMTTSSSAKVSTKSTSLIESIAGENILLNINSESQDDLVQKERDLDKSYITLNKDQVVIGIGSSKIILEKNKITIKADAIDIEGSNNINIKTKSLSVESDISTNIKSSGTLSIDANAALNIASKAVTSIQGSITKVG